MNVIKVFFTTNLAQIVWILAIAVGGRLLLALACARIIQAANDGDDERVSGREKRARTLAGLIRTTGNVALTIIVVIMTLQLFGLDPTPIIAGAGVLGFAVGFGAQTLIKDFLAGIFIFAENQFAVGDRVKIGSTEGTVHKMSMRSTVVCDIQGNLVFIPNGSISGVVNYSLGVGPDKGLSGHEESRHERRE